MCFHYYDSFEYMKSGFIYKSLTVKYVCFQIINLLIDILCFMNIIRLNFKATK